MREWAKILVPIAVVALPLWYSQVGAEDKAKTVEEILAELAPEIQTVRNMRQHFRTVAMLTCDPDGELYEPEVCAAAREHLAAMGEE